MAKTFRIYILLTSGQSGYALLLLYVVVNNTLLSILIQYGLFNPSSRRSKTKFQFSLNTFKWLSNTYGNNIYIKKFSYKITYFSAEKNILSV